MSVPSGVEVGRLRKDMRLAAKLLDLGLGRHRPLGENICNDVPSEFLAEYSHEELVEINREFHKYNGDPEESFENTGSLLVMQDFMYAYWLSKKYGEDEDDEPEI